MLTEKQYVERLVDAILSRDCAISVDDGGEEIAVVRSTDRSQILDALMNTDEDKVLAYKADCTNADGKPIFVGLFCLIYGNAPDEVISDYSDNEFCDEVYNQVTDLDYVIPVPQKHVLVTGGPSGGFTFYGPFDGPDDATRYAEEQNFQDSWWVAPLEINS